MWSWWTACQSLVVVSLLFLAIPIRVPDPEGDTRALFDDYVKRFRKPYLPGSEEYRFRYEAFKNTLLTIETYDNDTAYGLTEYSDLTETEFKAKHLDRVKVRPDRRLNKKKAWPRDDREPPKRQPPGGPLTLEETIRQDAVYYELPDKMDWRRFGIISPVIDQGICGACWAFSTVQTIEAMNAKLRYNLTLLSAQQMIDCSTNGNHGCAGGDNCNLLEWLFKFKISVQSAKDYPYNKRTNQCALKSIKTGVGVRILDYTCQSFTDAEMEILKWIANEGPVAVAVNALTWQNYIGSGVIQMHCDGDPMRLNHAVQLVGYDLTAEVPYYIGKNSWGSSFGDRGYVYLAIGRNVCGVANEVSMIRVV